MIIRLINIVFWSDQQFLSNYYILLVLAGMGIKTEEFSKAFTRFYFNLFVQAYNFGAVSSIVYGFSRLMLSVGVLPQVRLCNIIIMKVRKGSNVNPTIYQQTYQQQSLWQTA